MVKGGQKILSRIDWMQHKIDQTTAQADPDHVPLPILNIGRAKTNGKSKNPPNMKDGDQLTWAEGGRSLFEEVKAERMKRKALGLLNPSSESEQDEEEDKQDERREDMNLLNVKKIFDSESIGSGERQPRARSNSAKAKARPKTNVDESLLQSEQQNIPINIRSLKTTKFQSLVDQHINLLGDINENQERAYSNAEKDNEIGQGLVRQEKEE